MTNIYARLSKAREEFHKLPLKKTGRNKFAGFDYFELADFLIPAMDCLRANGLVTITTFTEDSATMYVRETEGDGEIAITSPMVRAAYTHTDEGRTMTVTQGAQLKGCHPIQNLGAEETYQRRYLWVALMEIVEHDALDATVGDEPASRSPKSQAPKKAAPKKTAEPKGTISTEAEAGALVDGMIEFVRKTESIQGLVSFWNANEAQIGILEKEYPTEHGRLKSAFTIAKERLT